MLKISFELVERKFFVASRWTAVTADLPSKIPKPTFQQSMRSFVVLESKVEITSSGNVTGIIMDNLIRTSDLTWIQL